MVSNRFDILNEDSTATTMDLASPVDPSPLSTASMWHGNNSSRNRRLQQQQLQLLQQQQQQQQHHGQTTSAHAQSTAEAEKQTTQAASSNSVRSPQWSSASSVAGNKRSSASASFKHAQEQHAHLHDALYLSSSPMGHGSFTISESRAVSTAVTYTTMQDVEEASEQGVTGMPSSSGSNSLSRASSSSSLGKNQPLDAKTSLMRIAQCGRHEDSWCAAQSGHYTRHYAESRPHGVNIDGRRAGR
ncbi:hypothetical protein BG004_002178, partial [Podila humilis]